MSTVTVHQAKTHLSKLLAAVQAGNEIIVCNGTRPVARLVPYRKELHQRPRTGEITSKRVKYAADCFAPLGDDKLQAWGMA